MKKKLPTISIIIVNRNGGSKLEHSLKLINLQSYPKDLVEILIIDGDSTDNSKELAKKFHAQFVDGGFSDNQEARRFIGAKKAKNEIIVWIDSDNYLPRKDWLKIMMKPFLEDKDIFAAETLRYAYQRDNRAFNRYCSLFGVNDPVAFYLGKADRLDYSNNKWTLAGKAVDKGEYFEVTFDQNLPTVGCNGFLIRRRILEKVLTEPESYFHTDVIFDLIKLGYNKIAFVKTDIIHDTSDSLRGLIKKRTDYYLNHSVKLAQKRRYQVFDPSKKNDRIHLLLFVLYTLTIVKPLFDATKGFVKKPDTAWFLHPMVCFIFLYAYSNSVIRSKLVKNKIGAL